MGYWVKTIHCKHFRFGRWGHVKNKKWVRLPGDGWKEALALYQAQRDDLYLGREPVTSADKLSILDLCNEFMEKQEEKLKEKDLSTRTFRDYKLTCKKIIDALGKNTLVEDLGRREFRTLRAELAKGISLSTLHVDIVRTKVVFSFAAKAGLIDKKVRYFDAFDSPKQSNMLKERNDKGRMDFSREEIHKILAVVEDTPILKALVLLCSNSGMGPTDLGRIKLDDIDWKTGWLSRHRGKTGQPRKFHLWEETQEAIRAYLEVRPKPQKGNEERLFLSPKGLDLEHQTTQTVLAGQFKKKLVEAGIYKRQKGFYSFRRMFQTVGEEAGAVATMTIMGHRDPSMGGIYRQTVTDQRLKKVTDHVHDWLFGE